ncbi:putative C2H2 finger domain protein [Aspergillus clavatus NRRL 1]|uniref:C2H2 finger domain protein, putative n=1 Tax=Aspergillus clavatus (strain ATCC 1007 / CBS 513.65 / DSM 816 / NCTC 3887 / NRRL 1 / QM 1276 / 107) TaxID=344612 RepID=A1C732_ASPCL|nr:C2H2 finger domain protein, putative [Aspergillus clavatus NRRL 1]EAW14203.1 C2H2 finger domain protein, putative [Aspergillus clavatus NRRL 1]
MHPFAYAEIPPIDLVDRTSFEDYQLYPSPDPHMSPAFHQESSPFQLQLSQLPTHDKGHYISAYTTWIDGSISPHAVGPPPFAHAGLHIAAPNAYHLASSWNNDISSTSGVESPRSSCDGNFAPSSLMEAYPSPPSIYDDPKVPSSNVGRYSSPAGSATDSVALPQIQSYPDPEPIVEPMYPLSPPQLLVYDGDNQVDEAENSTEAMSGIHTGGEIVARRASLPQAGRGKTRRNAPKTSQSGRVTKPVTAEKSRRKAATSTLAQQTGRKKTPKRASSSPRLFVCSFSHYGCTSIFTSKNEWKRHIGSQHLQLGYFRCDVDNCDDGHKASRKKYGHAIGSSRSRSASHDHSARQTNDFNRKDFNRKDLFTQHQRRMHAPWVLEGRSASAQELQAFEVSLEDVRSRCWREQRKPPQQSQCGFCAKEFSGPASWNERMEHVGRHFEKDEHSVPEEEDIGLRNWALSEGLIQRNDKGKWVLVALRG